MAGLLSPPGPRTLRQVIEFEGSNEAELLADAAARREAQPMFG